MGGATFHEFVHAIWLNGREMDLAPLVALVELCTLIVVHGDQIKLLWGDKAETAEPKSDTWHSSTV